MSRIPKPSFKEALLFWLKLGFISFGGPAGQIAIMHEFLVEKKKWISESKFLNALNYCMLLPGPEAQQMATYTGWMLHGVRGGIIAGVLFVLPSIFILLALSILYVLYGNLPLVSALFNGLKPAVVAIIMVAMFKIGKKSLSSVVHYLIAVGSFIAIFFFDVTFPLIVLAAIVMAFLIQKYAPQLVQVKDEKLNKNNELNYYINSEVALPHAKFSVGGFVKQVVIAMFLWIAPFVLFYFFTTDFAFWKTLSLFFTKAALVTFGGAYAVLPYVAQVSVNSFHWLSSFQMLDGLALGETTPGPLIMVLAFVGFMAGYNQYGASLLCGTLGLFTTVWFTFLPSFLFIFVGAPFIENTNNNIKLKSIMSIISAAVVGVILNLSIYLLVNTVFVTGRQISVSEMYNASWIILSVIALQRFKVNMILWIGISALAGLGFYLLFP